MWSLNYIGFGITIWWNIFHLVNSGSVSFCDGPELVEKSREQCGAGLSFGESKPDCICLNGVYRLVADSCETADGFAEKVCTKITDEAENGATIVGVKFTKDPVNWSQTGIVCERKGFGSDTWDIVTDKLPRGGATKSSNIYGLNGKAYMGAGHYDKKAFCLEPAIVPEEEKICRYLRSENSDIWPDGEIEVIVKPKCDGVPVLPHKCFGVLSTSDSECQLSCNSPRAKMGRSMGRGVKGKPPAPKAAPTTTTPKSTITTDMTHPAEYWKHDNKFLNRKMMIYNIISQLDTSGGASGGNGTSSNSTNETTSVWGEPKRTFELFDMMKNITTAYCPAEYIAPDWIDLVIELFYILHKGNIFRYDENLSPFEQNWIKEILTTCSARIAGNGTADSGEGVTLSSESGLNSVRTQAICNDNGGGKATGYCNGTVGDGDCNFTPIIVETHRANDSFHYVPDVAWNIVDLIQVICFKEFNESYRMFHVLEQAAEKLFTLQIKNLWYYPNWSEKTKKRLLGTSADTQMHNLEVCIYSAYSINGQIPRLVRPGPVKYLRKKRSVQAKGPENVGEFVDVFCNKNRRDFIMPTTCPAE